MCKLDKTETQMLDQTVKFEDVDSYVLEAEHYNDLKDELGYETIWSLDEGIMPLDKPIFTRKPRLVTYRCIESMGDNYDEVQWTEFTSTAVNGTVGELWRAAESVFKQAKATVGDWHIYIEDFQMQDDGSLKLVTGS
jgi:hypothetical protein